MKHPKSQRGSAIIMLFVAVALFGALAYAFMRNSRGSTAMISDEQAKIYAQQIIAYGNDVKMAVKRLQMRGCTFEQIAFTNTVYKAVAGYPYQPEGHNPNSPSDGRCDILKAAGGGLTPQILPKPALKTGTSATGEPGNITLEIIDIEDIGPSNLSELSLRTVQITKQICLKINELSGIQNPDGNPPNNIASSSRASYYLCGSSSCSGTAPLEPTTFLGNPDSTFRGKNFGCFNAFSPGENYHTYFVLWPR